MKKGSLPAFEIRGKVLEKRYEEKSREAYTDNADNFHNTACFSDGLSHGGKRKGVPRLLCYQ